VGYLDSLDQTVNLFVREWYQCFRFNFLGYWRSIKAFASQIESELDGFQSALGASIWWEGSLIDKGLTKWPFPIKFVVQHDFYPSFGRCKAGFILIIVGSQKFSKLPNGDARH